MIILNDSWKKSTVSWPIHCGNTSTLENSNSLRIRPATCTVSQNQPNQEQEQGNLRNSSHRRTYQNTAPTGHLLRRTLRDSHPNRFGGIPLQAVCLPACRNARRYIRRSEEWGNSSDGDSVFLSCGLRATEKSYDPMLGWDVCGHSCTAKVPGCGWYQYDWFSGGGLVGRGYHMMHC